VNCFRGGVNDQGLKLGALDAGRCRSRTVKRA
jgi:hypothetical protein